MKELFNSVTPRLLSLVAIVALVASIPVVATSAYAQLQGEGQADCIRQLNRAGAKVVKAQGKVTKTCLKAFSGAKITDVASCLTALDSKIGKSLTRTADAHAKYCGVVPDFGYGGTEAVNAAARDESVALVEDLFGDDLALGLATKAASPGSVKCQSAVAKAADKLLQSMLREFEDCKATALAGGAASASDLETSCLVSASQAGARVSKAALGITKAVQKKCLGGGQPADLAQSFAGKCLATIAQPAQLVDCLQAAIRCRACTMLNATDALGEDCELYDDDLANGSCGGVAPTTTTTTTTLEPPTTTTTTTTTTTVDLCDPGPDCSVLDDDCNVGVCNPTNGACTLSPREAGTECAEPPLATLAAIVVTDLSDPDDLVDPSAGDVHEWSSTLTHSSDDTTIDAHLAAAVGADACCTVEDEEVSATAAYRVSFQVVATEAWRVDVSHSILGAFSLLDESVALEDAGGNVSVSEVTGTYSVDGGAAVPFSFTPTPNSENHPISGSTSDTDTEFSGTAGAEIHGSGNASIVIDVSFDVFAKSDSNVTFPAAGGDEVAIRLGKSDSIANGFTAGAYPNGAGSLGARDPAGDGHFLAVRLVAFTCPGEGTCDGAGTCQIAAGEDCSSLDVECTTVGVCDDATRTCVAQAVEDGWPCEDGDLCTSNDFCSAGTCTTGPPTDCSGLDDLCVDGTCDAGTGNCVPDPKDAGTACGEGMPTAAIANVSVVDSSDADSKTDGATDVNEWRHALTSSDDTSSVSARLAGMAGADACCTTGDTRIDPSVSYSVSFDVVAVGDWEVDLSHSILGAFSLLDEKVALEDAGGEASISAISATYEVDGGGAVAFGFTPTPASVVHALGGGEGDSDVEFSGANAATIAGSGNASVVLNFAFDLTAFSNSNLTFPAAGGDEVAVRLGLGDTISNGFTAGEYPSGGGGLGARDAAGDGHFVSAVLRTTTCADAPVCDAEGACGTPTIVDCTSAGDACNEGICDAETGACAGLPLPAGTDCSDADACNGAETCDVDGVCQNGTPVDCSNLDDQCNDGVCDSETGDCSAAAKADGTACDDGDPCTGSDQCTAGVCAGTEIPGCGATIANAALVDNSSGDTKADGAGDVHEWGHTTSLVSTDTTIAANLKGVIGADACCTVGDEEISATAAYTVTFDVVSSLNWQLTLAHDILGAYTLFDESVALEDAGGRATVSAVSANYDVGGGPVSLGFTPVPGEVNHPISNSDSDSNVEFSGQNSTVIAGSGNASVTFVVSFDLFAKSDSNVAFPAAGGDEVAVRFGKNDTISNGFTAGEYPGPGSRDIAADGHFLDVSIVGLP